MTMTDPIADMLTRIRNANSAMFETVQDARLEAQGVPGRHPRARGLHRRLPVEPNTGSPGSTLEITLKYSADRTRTIAGIKRVSKPGLRIYARADGIPRVLGGMGVAVVSTSQGLMTDREARKRHLGGEVLCHVW